MYCNLIYNNSASNCMYFIVNESALDHEVNWHISQLIKISIDPNRTSESKNTLKAKTRVDFLRNSLTML
jgi:hypothetical protein